MTTELKGLREIGGRMVTGTPQAAALNMRLVLAGAEGAAMAVPWREDLVGDPDTGVMAGGVVTTLLDHVCGLSVSCAMAARNGGQFQEHSIATLDLRIDYMRAAEPHREVIAMARCYKLTRSIAFVRASAYEDDESDPIATVQAAFAFTGIRKPPTGEPAPGAEGGAA